MTPLIALLPMRIIELTSGRKRNKLVNKALTHFFRKRHQLLLAMIAGLFVLFIANPASAQDRQTQLKDQLEADIRTFIETKSGYSSYDFSKFISVGNFETFRTRLRENDLQILIDKDFLDGEGALALYVPALMARGLTYYQAGTYVLPSEPSTFSPKITLWHEMIHAINFGSNGEARMSGSDDHVQIVWAEMLLRSHLQKLVRLEHMVRPAGQPPLKIPPTAKIAANGRNKWELFVKAWRSAKTGFALPTSAQKQELTNLCGFDVHPDTIRNGYIYQTDSTSPVLGSYYTPINYSPSYFLNVYPELLIPQKNGKMGRNSLKIKGILHRDLSVQVSDYVNIHIDGDDQLDIPFIPVEYNPLTNQYEFEYDLADGEILEDGNYTIQVIAELDDNDLTPVPGPRTSFQVVPEALTVSAPYTSVSTNEPFSITAQLEGGTAPYKVQWTSLDKSVLLEKGETLNYPHGVEQSGEYGVRVTAVDSKGLTDSAVVYIDIHDDLHVSLPITSQFRPDENASVTPVIKGGVDPYQIDWYLDGSLVLENVSTFFLPANTLPEGTYAKLQASVTDAVDDSDTASTWLEISLAEALKLTLEDTHVYNDTENRIVPKITGGTPPYEIMWDFEGDSYGPWDTLGIPEGYTPGTYRVSARVSDAEAIYAEDSMTLKVFDGSLRIEIPQGPELKAALGESHIITAEVTGAKDGYSIMWHDNSINSHGDGDSFTIRARDAAGTFAISAIVTDGQGNTASTSIDVMVGSVFSNADINVTSHVSGSVVSENVITLTGTVNAIDLSTNAQVANYIEITSGEHKFRTATTNGNTTFSQKIPLEPGENTLTLRAIHVDAAGNEIYLEGQTDFIIKANIEMTAIYITLTWDQAVDIDLYVSNPAGETVYYENLTDSAGGFLDVDNMEGYGPEHYTLFVKEGNTVYWDQPYTVSVNYYDGEVPTSYKVSISVLGHSTVTRTGVLSEKGETQNLGSYIPEQTYADDFLDLIKTLLGI